MSRYIDADKAEVERISCFYGAECRIEDVKEWLDEQPTADVQEVKHGKWLTTGAYPHRVYCSLCFKNYVTNEEIILERAKEPHPIFCTEAEYCPHCGAKMDGKDGT